MTRKNKWIVGSIAALIGLISLPLAVVLLVTASNAIPAAYYLLFTTQPTNQELAGEYVVQLRWGKATLSIHPDYTFQETVVADGKGVQTVVGNWTVKSVDAGHTAEVSLKPYINVQDDDYGQRYDYATLLFNKPRLGQIFAQFNPDSGSRFEKQSKQEAR
jgi:hypothetical protein